MQKLKSITINNSHDYVSLFFVLFATLLGAVVRFYPTFLSNFPLNDGGLFYRMTQDLLDHHFSLPIYVSYNGNDIPFSYPPFAFYLMAFLNHFFHIGIINQLHYLPPFFSTLTIPALYFLSKRLTGSLPISAFAVFAFALMPNSYIWLIMGGGISRAPGILFAILAILFIWEMFRTPKIPTLLLSMLFCSLTILSHPGTTWFLFLTILLISFRYGLNRKGIQYALFTIFGILLITSPWWVVIVQRFGASTFINASQTGGFFNLSIVLFHFTGESFTNILAVIALLGLFAEITRRRFFLSAWLILIAIFSPRSGELFAAVPAAMLFGSGVVRVLIPGLVGFKKWVQADILTLEDIFQERISKLAFSVILVYSLFSAMVVPILGNTEIRTLSQYDRQAMTWASQNTEVDSKFIVITGEEWPIDFISEWFPALSGRISISTVQGSEWLPDQQFTKRIETYKLLQSCALKDFSCLLSWAKDNSISYSYLYLSKSQVGQEGTSFPLANSPAPSDHFKLAYENPGVLIYKVVGNP